jgi:hypothetical protein
MSKLLLIMFSSCVLPVMAMDPPQPRGTPLKGSIKKGIETHRELLLKIQIDDPATQERLNAEQQEASQQGRDFLRRFMSEGNDTSTEARLPIEQFGNTKGYNLAVKPALNRNAATNVITNDIEESPTENAVVIQLGAPQGTSDKDNPNEATLTASTISTADTTPVTGDNGEREPLSFRGKIVCFKNKVHAGCMWCINNVGTSAAVAAATFTVGYLICRYLPELPEILKHLNSISLRDVKLLEFLE